MTKVQAKTKKGETKSVDITPVIKKGKTHVASKSLKIVLDEPDFQPKEVQENLIYQVRILSPYQASYNKQCTVFMQKSVEVLDFGIKFQLEEKDKNLYVVRASIMPEFSSKGLILSNAYLDDNGRLKLVVINVGPSSPVIVNHKECFANVWLEDVSFQSSNHVWSFE